MDTIDKEKIKESVRESYAKVAKAGGVSIESSMAASCCAHQTLPPTPMWQVLAAVVLKLHLNKCLL